MYWKNAVLNGKQKQMKPLLVILANGKICHHKNMKIANIYIFAIKEKEGSTI